MLKLERFMKNFTYILSLKNYKCENFRIVTSHYTTELIIDDKFVMMMYRSNYNGTDIECKSEHINIWTGDGSIPLRYNGITCTELSEEKLFELYLQPELNFQYYDILNLYLPSLPKNKYITIYQNKITDEFLDYIEIMNK